MQGEVFDIATAWKVVLDDETDCRFVIGHAHMKCSANGKMRSSSSSFMFGSKDVARFIKHSTKVFAREVGDFERIYVLFAIPVDGGKPAILDYKSVKFTVIGDNAGDDHN
jgi:hypothetical protein